VGGSGRRLVTACATALTNYNRGSESDNGFEGAEGGEVVNTTPEVRSNTIIRIITSPSPTPWPSCKLYLDYFILE
jgi:hypothetical protein